MRFRISIKICNYPLIRRSIISFGNFILAFLFTSVFAQNNITRVEYFIDNDPGLGNATVLNITPDTGIANLNIPINPSVLAAGVHHLFVRARDAVGNWSLTNNWFFYKPYAVPNPSVLSNIDLIEYYFDTDPGVGKGTSLPLTPDVDLSNLVISINPERLPPCSHILYLRARDADGNWSLLNSYSFVNNYQSPTEPPGDFMVQFDGVDDYVDLGTWFNLPNFTISFWVKPDSIQSQGATIAAIQNDLYFYSNPNAQNNYVLSHLLQLDLAPNQWNHVTITVDSATKTRRVYLFGQLIDSNQWVYSPATGFDLRFGNGGFFPNSYFKGQLDEIRLWDNVLDQDQVYKNVNSKLTGMEQGLVGYWDFNNGCDPKAIDKTPNHHNGTLINGASKLTSTVPDIGQQVIPNKGGNTNIVTIKIYDNLFQHGASAKLTRADREDIVADTTVINSDSSIASCTFDLNGKDTGLYNIVIINPDSTLKIYPNSFTIEQGGLPDLWVNLIGRNAVRNGRPYTFQVSYGNNANVDALGVPIWIIFKGDTSIKVKPKFDILKPNGFETNYLYDTIPTYFNTDSLWGEPETAKVMPLYIPKIPAGSFATLTFSLENFSNVEIEARIDRPFYHSPLPPEVINCIKNLIDNAIDAILGIIPGVGCGLQVYSTILEWKKYIHSTIDAPSNVSMLWNFVAMVGECLKETFPGYWYYKIASLSLSLAKAINAHNECDQAFADYNKSKMPVSPVYPFDPNEKVGPTKFQQNKVPFSYSILFENLSSATASAQEVTVIDTLDKSKFDINTFSFGPIGFGDTLVSSTYQYHKNFSKKIDLRPFKNLIVQTEGRVDTTLGIVYWKFTSLDPATMLLTDDPFLGFLPPNVTSPEGEGRVSFTIKPYDGLPTGEILKNKATIIFDNNNPIITNNYQNSIDNIAPHSKIQPLPRYQQDSNFVVKWSGTDTISGVKEYNIYVSIDSENYTLWKANTADTIGIYPGNLNHTYSFYSIATDSAGNIEKLKTLFEAITTITNSSLPITLIDFQAKLQNSKSVILYWSTTNAHNFKEFEIERSTNSISFDKIGGIQSTTSNQSISNYSFVDKTPADGVNFYRLKLIDIDGHYTFSKILTIDINNWKRFKILPNPAHSILTINGEGLDHFTLYDMIGRKIYERQRDGQSPRVFDISKFAKGLYILSLTNTEGAIQTEKLIIQ